MITEALTDLINRINGDSSVNRIVIIGSVSTDNEEFFKNNFTQITSIEKWNDKSSYDNEIDMFVDADNDEFLIHRFLLKDLWGSKKIDLYYNYILYLVKDYFQFSWDIIEKNVKREFLKKFFDSNGIRKVVLPSLNGLNGVFYSNFSNDITIELCNDEKCKNDIVLCFCPSEGVYENYKIKIDELYAILFYLSVMSKAWRASYFESKSCALSENNTLKEIELFDSGMTSIIYHYSNDELYNVKFLSEYKRKFPGSVSAKQEYILLSDTESMIEIASFKLLQYYNESIPVVDGNGQLTGYVKKRDERRYEISPRWDLISDSTILYLLDGYERILISSSENELLRFKDRVKDIKEIEILSNDNFEQLLNGEYDLIIGRCDIWGNIPVLYMDVKQFYINAYCIDISNYFRSRGIGYIFCGLPESDRIFNHRKRVSSQSKQYVNNLIEDFGTYTVADGTIDNCVYYHGRRRTTDILALWDKSVYFCGPCISIGVFAKDDKTIESHLQRLINQNDISARVINNPAPLLLNPLDSAINTLHRIGQGRYRKGDIVVHFGRNNLEWLGITDSENSVLDLTDVFNCKKNADKKCFIGHMGAHVDESGYEAVADKLFDYIGDKLRIKSEKGEFYQYHDENVVDQNSGLEKYIEFLRREKFICDDSATIGAVAVNANPFTLGHVYLIEEARKKSDYLYVFVAEEDLSDFSFEVRFMLVSEYCKSYENVKVLPSGRFFASTISFGDYFNREARPSVIIDASFDCDFFAKVIAKELNISFRILGEENHDIITNQYNNYVKDILTQNGVDVQIISRARNASGIISAKKVRECIKAKKFKELKTLVPEVTYNYVINNIK